MEKPDYNKYTLEQLYDVLKHIDKEAYQDRYLEIKEILNDKDRFANLKEQQIKLDEKKSNDKQEFAAGVSAIYPIIIGVLILLFGVGFNRLGTAMEFDSNLERIIFGGIFIVVGVFSCYKLFYGKNTNKPNNKDAKP